jgi:hypothetical protein
LVLASLAVSVIAKRRQGVAVACEGTDRDSIQQQRRLAVTTPGRDEAALDGCLVVRSPRAGVLEIVFIQAPGEG